MEPRPITPADIDRFPGHRLVSMRAPTGMEDTVSAVDVLKGENGITMVPFQPDEIDVVKLAHGGTVWCVFMGTMPPMYVEVSDA